MRMRPWTASSGTVRRLVSAILGESCHSQFRAICADITEVQTTKSKGPVEREDDSAVRI